MTIVHKRTTVSIRSIWLLASCETKNLLKHSLHILKERYSNLFENELTSDVVLMVGEDEAYQERVPAHTWVLANGNDYFRALFEGPLANSTTSVYQFPDNPKGFNNLIQWIYQNKCDIQNLHSNLDTLQLAIKYLCPELADYCIRHMTKQLAPDNVLVVLSWIYQYCQPESSVEPSAPSYAHIVDSDRENDTQRRDSDPQRRNSDSQRRNSSEDQGLDPTISCYQLLSECLQLIDKQTETVLMSESLLHVEAFVLGVVLRRENLNIKSELVVFEAIHRWSTACCKKQLKLLTQEFKREALGEQLLFAPRYLSLSQTEINCEKNKRDLLNLLTEDELSFLVSSVNGSYEQVVPYSMLDVREAIATKRSPDGPVANVNTKKPKKLKKKTKKRDLILNLVSVLAVIFD